MSTIIVSPKHRAENSIYLVFSIVMVTFVLYAAEWLQGHSTGVGFQPNLGGVAVAAAFIAAALMYAAPDEEILHRLLARHAYPEDRSTGKFILFSVLTLRTYVLPASKIRRPSIEFAESKDTVLEGGDLDADIWRLRGAFWIILSIPLSVLVAASTYNWESAPFTFLGIAAAAAVIVLLVSGVGLYGKTSRALAYLAEFLWFDRSLTAIRRSEVTVERNRSELRLTTDGLSESIYRAIRGTQVAESDTDEVPSVVKPRKERKHGRKVQSESRVTISGRITDKMSVERMKHRRFRERLSAECELLRELVRRENWASFQSRFLNLRDSIVHEAANQVDSLLLMLVEYWEKSMEEGHLTHRFTHFRTLCHLMDQENLLNGMTDIEVLRILLKYDDTCMADRHWVYSYYVKKMERHALLDSAFTSLASHIVDKSIEAYGPPEEPLPVEDKVEMIEEHYQSEIGFETEIFHDVPLNRLESARTMEYD